MASNYYSRDTHPRIEIGPSALYDGVDVIRYTRPNGVPAAQLRMLDRENFLLNSIALELYDPAFPGTLGSDWIRLTELELDLRHETSILIGAPNDPDVHIMGVLTCEPGVARGGITHWERGRTAVTFAGTNFKDTSLTYSVPFPSSPTIQTTCVEGASSPIGNWSTQVFNASATGCTVRVRDFTLTNRTGTVNFEHWACL